MCVTFALSKIHTFDPLQTTYSILIYKYTYNIFSNSFPINYRFHSWRRLWRAVQSTDQRWSHWTSLPTQASEKQCAADRSSNTLVELSTVGKYNVCNPCICTPYTSFIELTCLSFLRYYNLFRSPKQIGVPRKTSLLKQPWYFMCVVIQGIPPKVF